MPQKLMLIDNYDSFTFNLVHLIEVIFDGKIDVIRNDEIEVKSVANYDLIVFSPGPKLPKDAGKMMEIIHQYHSSKPMLGICLGMQGMAEYFGSKLSNLEFPEHGQSKKMKVISNHFIFKNCPDEFLVGRYHSWGIQKNDLSNQLVPLSIDEKNWVMSFVHNKYKIIGLQYHPESILSEYGKEVMENCLSYLSE
jgi:anthranilate synthase component 2